MSQDIQRQGHMLSGTTRGHHHITLGSHLQVCAAVSLGLAAFQKAMFISNAVMAYWWTLFFKLPQAWQNWALEL